MLQQDAQPGAAACGEREAARLRQVGFGLRQFCNHRRHRAAAQRLFHRPEHVDGARHAERDETRGIHAGRLETRRVRLSSFDAGKVGCDPEHVALPRAGSGRQRPCEACGRPKVDRGIGRQLMQSCAGQAAAESAVDARNAKRQELRRIGQPRRQRGIEAA